MTSILFSGNLIYNTHFHWLSVKCINQWKYFFFKSLIPDVMCHEGQINKMDDILTSLSWKVELWVWQKILIVNTLRLHFCGVCANDKVVQSFKCLLETKYIIEICLGHVHKERLSWRLILHAFGNDLRFFSSENTNTRSHFQPLRQVSIHITFIQHCGRILELSIFSQLMQKDATRDHLIIPLQYTTLTYRKCKGEICFW